MEKRHKSIEKEEKQFIEKVIQIDRVNKVVKGGKRLAFRALVIVGDGKGQVGIALGKSKEVPIAIKKGIEKAKKTFKKINMVGNTIPHLVLGNCGASRVLLKPARPGTGVIAGGAIRILLEAVGIKDIVAKSLCAGSAINTAKAALQGLLSLKDLEEETKIRGKLLPVRYSSTKVAISLLEENESNESGKSDNIKNTESVVHKSEERKFRKKEKGS